MKEKSPVYLVMVTTNNNNKYYRMIPHGDTFEAEYGRVGASCQHASYSMSQWNKKYNEKIKKRICGSDTSCTGFDSERKTKRKRRL